ncbi:MAG: hypothetical protein IT427_03200 [Pirellulales bacterium]|nr:hypothetical protein [Pirellulales bacterium]
MAQPFPTNNDPTNEIRFNTPAEADAKRDQLIDFIWNNGLPSTLPSAQFNVSLPRQAVDIDPLNVERVDRLDSDVSGWDFHMSSYLIHPRNQSSNTNRVVLVQQGHSGILELGVGATANYLLQNGFTIAVMEMPLLGWNTDRTAAIPGRGNFGFSDHNRMITDPAVNNDGQGFRLFLEPVVQTINFVTASNPNLQEIGMIGLSGGGWYTQMMAAIDPRIKLSVPVAGSAPLYQRNVDPGSVGDTEQYFVPLYDENIASDGSGGGVATWLEIYALGGYGSGRHQVQVTNQFDSCCFSGTFADSYKSVLVNKVDSLGAGKFEYYRDSTHHSHQISPNVINQVIGPLFGIVNPLPLPSGLPIQDSFDNQTNAFPSGWKLDALNGPGATAIENEGRLSLFSTGSAAIAHESLVNAAEILEIAITLQIAEISPDSMSGVLLSANDERTQLVGLSFDAPTKQLILDADSGGGFSAATDRLVLGTLPNYSGGAATMEILLSQLGFSVSFDAGAAGNYESAMRPWSDFPGGFSLAALGNHARLLLQCLEADAGTAAHFRIDSISVEVQTAAMTVAEPCSISLMLIALVAPGVLRLRAAHPSRPPGE